jgi:hypothetical protein
MFVTLKVFKLIGPSNDGRRHLLKAGRLKTDVDHSAKGGCSVQIADSNLVLQLTVFQPVRIQSLQIKYNFELGFLMSCELQTGSQRRPYRFTVAFLPSFPSYVMRH